MASALSHAVVAVGFSEGLHRDEGRWRICFWGIVCSVVPDLDVVGFRFGVRYGDLWGHRGLTHSLAFAALFGSIVAFLVFRGRRWDAIRPRLLFYFCAVAASHGMLDAMTNGGLGIAFFSPFDTTRYFLPFRPVEVSPIGVREFFTRRAWNILISEMKWIWIPAAVTAGLFRVWHLGKAVFEKARAIQ